MSDNVPQYDSMLPCALCSLVTPINTLFVPHKIWAFYMSLRLHIFFTLLFFHNLVFFIYFPFHMNPKNGNAVYKFDMVHIRSIDYRAHFAHNFRRLFVWYRQFSECVAGFCCGRLIFLSFSLVFLLVLPLRRSSSCSCFSSLHFQFVWSLWWAVCMLNGQNTQIFGSNDYEWRNPTKWFILDLCCYCLTVDRYPLDKSTKPTE